MEDLFPNAVICDLSSLVIILSHEDLYYAKCVWL